MIEFYTSLKRKIAEFILEIYLIFYSLFVVYNEYLNDNITFLLGLNFLTIAAIYSIYRQSNFQSKYCQLILFICYNPLFDTLIADFTIITKVIFYVLVAVLYFNFIFKNIKIIYFSNTIFLAILFALTITIPSKFQILQKSNSHTTNYILDKINQNENVDIIILDAYPDFKILKDSFHAKSNLNSFLSKHKFTKINHHSYSTKTPISLAQIFLNQRIKPAEITLESMDKKEYYNLIKNSNIQKICNHKNYQFDVISPINYKFNNEGWQIYWNRSNSRYFGLFMRTLNNWRKIRFLFTQYSSTSKITFEEQYNYHQLDLYNNSAIAMFSKNLDQHKKHISIYHLLTLHKYDKNHPLEAFKNDLHIADSLGIGMVSSLLNKKNSNIIILSDHGNRTMLKSPYSKKMGMMAIKEL